MIRRKLNETRPGTDQTKAINTIAEVSVGDVSVPVVKSGGLNIITTTDLESNPVITEAEVISLPEETRPGAGAQMTVTGETTTSGETVQPTEAPKKPFPWWLLLVGAGIIYVITRKK